MIFGALNTDSSNVRDGRSGDDGAAERPRSLFLCGVDKINTGAIHPLPAVRRSPSCLVLSHPPLSRLPPSSLPSG
jgi:hypothetical protein